ncbi:hypothetical protein LCGC14_1125100 [marine sediment metagenome]|uniref:Uncharacterized protein n=1 Tax=marine sediment metagenome TaxID=412755 RepID=A0A0F9M2V6_9ZZZZ
MVIEKKLKPDTPLYCQCCNRNVMAVIKGGAIVITKRGHHLTLPLVDKDKD